MSNTAYLIANDVPGGATDDVGWTPADGEGVADGPHAVPVFWLALFDEGDLCTVAIDAEDEALEIPSLAADLGDARRRFRDRRGLLMARFPEFEPTWERFDAVLHGLDARYIKVDVTELWDLAACVDEDFGEELRAAVRWFETRDEDDFAQLLSIASIQGYDMRRRSFPALAEEVPRAFHLRGYAGDSTRWDDDADV